MESALQNGLKKSSPSAAYDFTLHVRRLLGDIAARVPDLRHVDVDRVAIRTCQVRSTASHGVQATLTPLRFEGGQPLLVRDGRQWTVERLEDAWGREMLYLLSFYVPRFLDRSLRDKLITICHELLHIGPQFDGDLRRLAGRCYAHGRRERDFDLWAERLADEWLSLNPPRELYELFQLRHRELCRRFGLVIGTRIATPKLILLAARDVL